MIVAIRISRRAIGVVRLIDEQYEFSDARYLPSDKGNALTAGENYLIKMLTQLTPEVVAIYAPSSSDSITRALAEMLIELLHARAIPTILLDKLSLHRAFAAATTKQMRTMMDQIWPEAGQARKAVRALLLEAAAGAIAGECVHALGGRG
jgi:hypothetical protein